ncbi:MAG: hypothetical protein HF975_04405 [ANME-2 cluster archaeon]|nr:hypothetical protein [ANME-2 cluster archaeon]
MNETGFDVWCKEKDDWENDSAFISPDGKLYYYNFHSMVQLNQNIHEILWHVGIEDITGKELKIGDIVKRRNGEIYVVQFNQEYAKFQIERVHDQYPVDFMELKSFKEQLQIVGHIHENPELTAWNIVNTR